MDRFDGVMADSSSFETSNVAIIIPAWNEEATIAAVVETVRPFGVAVVVNDASTDRTGELAAQAGAVVVTHDKNRGYDGALNSGFERAFGLGAQYFITFDADGQHDAKNLPGIIEMLKSGADLVVGTRSRRPRISEKIMALVIWGLYGLRDPVCGLKGYRRSLYADAGCFDSCKSIGTQLAVYACRRKKIYRTEQFPVRIHERKDTPRLGCSLKANVRIFLAIFRVLRYR
jgi:glycosyltransferase involved in cell wall biosynthesis